MDLIEIRADTMSDAEVPPKYVMSVICAYCKAPELVVLPNKSPEAIT